MHRTLRFAFLLFALHSSDLRAELVFRSLDKSGGEPRWSDIKKYSNPQDVAYERGGVDEVRVFVTGAITREDGIGAAVLERLVQAGTQKISGNVVWLASNGGDIDAAMTLGRVLRRFGAYTMVAKGEQCMSACVFAFMGGERRIVAGQLGIHRPFFSTTQAEPDRLTRFRYMQKVLRGYFEEMDFPSSLYEAVMLVPPESMKILAPAELKQFYLEGISPSSEDVADAASARRLGLSMAAYLVQKAAAPACAFYVSGQGRCESPSQDMAARAVAPGNAGSPQGGAAASASRAQGSGQKK
jgi:hypothetical protein